MRWRGKFFTIAAAFVCLCSVIPRFTSSACIAVSGDWKIRNADLIFIGTASRERSYQDGDQGPIDTDYTFENVEIIKGSDSGGHAGRTGSVILTQMGGTVGKITAIAEDVTTFTIGQRVVVMASRWDGKLSAGDCGGGILAEVRNDPRWPEPVMFVRAASVYRLPWPPPDSVAQEFRSVYLSSPQDPGTAVTEREFVAQLKALVASQGPR